MLNLLTYISILSLGLIGLYRLRSGLLIIQRRRDASQKFSKSSGISQDICSGICASTNTPSDIIPKEDEHCKHFKCAG